MLYGVDILSYANVYNWHNKFSAGHEKISDLPHADFKNRKITVCDIASNSSISNGSVETIIHEHLLLKKLNAWWVPKALMTDQKAQHVAVSTEHLQWFELREIHF
jgi:hypothetical protein